MGFHERYVQLMDINDIFGPEALLEDSGRHRCPAFLSVMRLLRPSSSKAGRGHPSKIPPRSNGSSASNVAQAPTSSEVERTEYPFSGMTPEQHHADGSREAEGQ
jgi:hypothetical protein